MEGDKISCPKCGSDDHIFTEETRVHTCNSCKHNFTMVFISYGHDNCKDLAFKFYDRLEKDYERKEGIYNFIHKQIQSALKLLADQKSHKRAIKYYQKKLELIGANPDDSREIIYHKSKTNAINQKQK